MDEESRARAQEWLERPMRQWSRAVAPSPSDSDSRRVWHQNAAFDHATMHNGDNNTYNTVNNIGTVRLIKDKLDRQDIINWLSSTSNQWAKHDEVRQRHHKGTLSWFLDSRQLRDFLAGQTPVLWGVGQAGAGKSVLMSAVIEKLLDKTAESDDEAAGLAFYYCSYQEETSATQILGSLLGQLIRRADKASTVTEVVEEMEDSYRRHPQLAPKAEKIRIWLWRVVEEARRNCRILLDGLDEIDQSTRDEIIAVIKAPKASIFVTSRDLPDIEASLQADCRYEVKAHQSDITAYVSDRLASPAARPFLELIDEEPGRSDAFPSLLQEVEHVVGTTQGMFLLTSLWLNTVMASVTLEDVYDSLDILPQSLDDFYDASWFRMMNPKHPNNPRYAGLILLWMTTCSVEGMFNERAMQYALFFTPRPRKTTARYPREKDLIRANSIRDVCTGLLIKPDPLNLSFVHFSTREYFENRRSKLFPEAIDVVIESFKRYAHVGESLDRASSARRGFVALDIMFQKNILRLGQEVSPDTRNQLAEILTRRDDFDAFRSAIWLCAPECDYRAGPAFSISDPAETRHFVSYAAYKAMIVSVGLGIPSMAVTSLQLYRAMNPSLQYHIPEVLLQAASDVAAGRPPSSIPQLYQPSYSVT